jgi:cyclase
MLRPRVIPCLLVRNKGLVKTRRFGDDKYVGDPINAVRIFNEKEVDELIVLDLDATSTGSGIDYKLVERLAAECRMPLAYGGGVQTVEQASRLIGLGVEKVTLGAAAFRQPQLLREIVRELGSQSVVAVVDAKKRILGQRWEARIINGRVGTGRCPIELAREFEDLGVGEIIVNSIDHDGMMDGYDLELAERIRSEVSVPMTVLGGAGSLEDMRILISLLGVIGAAAGSLFVFKGPYRAVLINYPAAAEKDALIAAAVLAGK